MRRMILLLFRHNRYRGAATDVSYFMQDREKLAAVLGGASRVTLHARVYDLGSGGALSFAINQGCFGKEMPTDGPRLFTLTPAGLSPSALPWENGNMATRPDDGTLYVTPTMGLVDIVMRVSGGSSSWVECWQGQAATDVQLLAIRIAAAAALVQGWWGLSVALFTIAEELDLGEERYADFEYSIDTPLIPGGLVTSCCIRNRPTDCLPSGATENTPCWSTDPPNGVVIGCCAGEHDAPRSGYSEWLQAHGMSLQYSGYTLQEWP